jgi:hypothetical protein
LRMGPRANDEPDEKPDKYRADERRELMSAKLRHNLRERRLAQRAVRDSDEEHGNPGEHIAGQVGPLLSRASAS